MTLALAADQKTAILSILCDAALLNHITPGDGGRCGGASMR